MNARHRKAVAAALGSLLVASAAHATPSPVLPGYWDSTENYSVLLSGASHARKCLTESQVSDFISSPQTKHYRCVYASRTVGDGRAAFRGGSCYSHAGRKVLSDVDVDGVYAPESFRLAFRFKLNVSAGVGLPGSADIEAHRISAQCPVEETPGG